MGVNLSSGLYGDGKTELCRSKNGRIQPENIFRAKVQCQRRLIPEVPACPCRLCFYFKEERGSENKPHFQKKDSD
ncbi:hypothetical protein NPIL_490581 [Nephila pilipes]|uniref:Uncharacterized protein n=1 Tax=Nephila pilipes TaxID=299642 RepID=A0A8X6TVV5_NEPPI|nr:hypothetical protein NPIL_490581 [Nephila pilipes]